MIQLSQGLVVANQLTHSSIDLKLRVFKNSARKLPIGAADKFAAHRFGLILAHAELGESKRVENTSVTGPIPKLHWVIGTECINLAPRGLRICKDRITKCAFDPFALGSFCSGSGKSFLHLQPRRILTLDDKLLRLRRDREMIMCVVEARNHSVPRQVYT